MGKAEALSPTGRRQVVNLAGGGCRFRMTDISVKVKRRRFRVCSGDGRQAGKLAAALRGINYSQTSHGVALMTARKRPEDRLALPFLSLAATCSETQDSRAERCRVDSVLPVLPTHPSSFLLRRGQAASFQSGSTQLHEILSLAPEAGGKEHNGRDGEQRGGGGAFGSGLEPLGAFWSFSEPLESLLDPISQFLGEPHALRSQAIAVGTLTQSTTPSVAARVCRRAAVAKAQRIQGTPTPKGELPRWVGEECCSLQSALQYV
ncbi:hypothetical protein GQ53DRAFT_28406 [Thozetella sp. PMI_491]|nr:hypothetical protein GQ53DRAFT_28406 [Thozetella sp. PMI_491]